MPTMTVAPRMTKHWGRKRWRRSMEKSLWNEKKRERSEGAGEAKAIWNRQEEARAYAEGIACARQAYAEGIACRYKWRRGVSQIAARCKAYSASCRRQGAE